MVVVEPPTHNERYQGHVLSALASKSVASITAGIMIGKIQENEGLCSASVTVNTMNPDQLMEWFMAKEKELGRTWGKHRCLQGSWAGPAYAESEPEEDSWQDIYANELCSYRNPHHETKPTMFTSTKGPGVLLYIELESTDE